MPRSYTNLWPTLTSWDNLLLAYRKCRRRKRFKRGAVEFDYCWESELIKLKSELTEGRYKPGPYRHFYIREPKKRKISAAPFRDRVVHHAIVNVLEPLFERSFIFDSYACRKEKGTHRALDRAQSYLRNYPFYIKTDLVKFFPNIDHQSLMSRLERRIHDESVLDLLQVILDSGVGILDDEAPFRYFPGDDLFAILRPRGLPIGNLTSQFLANVFLDPIDHFVKEELCIPGYVRYADDLVLFAGSKSRLWDAKRAIEEKLGEMRLRLHEHKTHLRPSRSGLPFLGFWLFHCGRRLNQAGIRRFVSRRRRAQKAYQNKQMSASDVRKSLEAWRAHTRQANVAGLWRDLLRDFHLVRAGHSRVR